MKTKKIVLLLIIMNLFVLSTWAVPQAHANVATKPLAITAKKVAKDLAEDSAVAMANEIVSQFLVRELLDDVKVDEGFAAVCMDGSKDKMEDCPVDKRAQVKKDLTSSDRSKLASTVETVLEQKTNTSSKWQKFLDFFIPIFLISGLVATFDAMLDDDSESFIDEVAQQALIDAGLMKGLLVTRKTPLYDFSSVIQGSSVKVERSGSIFTVKVQNAVKTNQSISMDVTDSNGKSYTRTFPSNYYIGLLFAATQNPVSGTYYPYTVVASVYPNTSNPSFTLGNAKLDESAVGYPNMNDAVEAAKVMMENNHISRFTALNGDINGLNNLVSEYITKGGAISYNLETLAPPEVETNFGNQRGFEKTKNPDGTKTLPGVDSFTYTYNNTNVYPATDSTTGWKDKTTGEDITVVEDDIVVDEGTTPIDPDKPPEEEENEFYCTQKMKFPDFKPVGNAFTNAFPFSIPWDIKRAIDAAFDGVGDSKPSFPLPMFGDGVVLTVPDMIDNWMPFLRGFLVLMFDVSILFLFYRFMKGGGD